MKERLERWFRGGFNLVELIVANAMVMVMQVAEDIAQGIPAPGNFTPGRFIRRLLILWVLNTMLDRFVAKAEAEKSIKRFRGVAALLLILSVYFFFETWSVARKLLLSGVPAAHVLQQAGIWLACCIIILFTGIYFGYCAWTGSRQAALEHARSLEGNRTKDERDAEILKRASHTAFMVSMFLFFLLLPLIELIVLKRYPFWSLATGGMVGLTWGGAYAYWSHKI